MRSTEEWQPDLPGVRRHLVDDGWQTPDTYSNDFSPLPGEAGVYLFICFNELFRPVGVGYVGSARDLTRRLVSSHETYRLIERDGFWLQRWFKCFPELQIRMIEKSYIRRFDPPYNIVWRRRGVQ